MNLSELLYNLLDSEQAIKLRIYILKGMNTALVMFQITIQSHWYAKHVYPIPAPSLNLTFIVILIEEKNHHISQIIQLSRITCSVASFLWMLKVTLLQT